MVELVLYSSNFEQETLQLIKSFWLEHNNYRQSDEETKGDIAAWTGEGHRLYLILSDSLIVGFIHLGSRGAECDWLEDIYVKSEYQNRGIGTKAVKLAEDIVSQYSSCLYIEAAARNRRAIRLYSKLGYNCLNTITVRKDFSEGGNKVLREETVWDNIFEIRGDGEE